MEKNIKKRVLEMDLRHNLGLQASEFRTVVSKLVYQSTDEFSDGDLTSAIKSIVNNVRHNPLKEEIRAKSELDLSKCTVCGAIGKSVTLMDDRPVYYCTVHREVTPKVKKADA